MPLLDFLVISYLACLCGHVKQTQLYMVNVVWDEVVLSMSVNPSSTD